MIVLVDGSNTVLRLASAAKHSGEAGDFIRMLLEFLYWNGSNAEQMIFFWEGQDSTKRKREIFSDYKQGKPRTKEEEKYIKNSFDLAKEILNGLNICNVQIESCEADDLIAHIALNSNKQIRIISEDRDYIQLLTKNNIELNRPIKRKIIKGLDVLDEEGIIVENFALAKALCGDKSDNIKGLTSIEIPRLVHYFPELCLKKFTKEEFLENISTIEYINENKFQEKRDYSFRCALIEKIINNQEQLNTNIKLIKMEPLPELEKNKLEYLINNYNNKERKIDRKILIQLMTMNNIPFNLNKFQNLFIILTKICKNKVEF